MVGIGTIDVASSFQPDRLQGDFCADAAVLRFLVFSAGRKRAGGFIYCKFGIFRYSHLYVCSDADSFAGVSDGIISVLSRSLEN